MPPEELTLLSGETRPMPESLPRDAERKMRRRLLARGFTAEQISEVYILWSEIFADDVEPVLAKKHSMIGEGTGFENGVGFARSVIGSTVARGLLTHANGAPNLAVPARLRNALLDLIDESAHDESGQSIDDLISVLKSHFAQGSS